MSNYNPFEQPKKSPRVLGTELFKVYAQVRATRQQAGDAYHYLQSDSDLYKLMYKVEDVLMRLETDLEQCRYNPETVFIQMKTDLIDK